MAPESPANSGLTFAEITKNGFGYSSVLAAIEKLILMRTHTLPGSYRANFEGITRALWDLGVVLAGDIPPAAGSTAGNAPPGWDPVSGGYWPGMAPANGSFWYDTRSGRLFVAFDQQWYQANGGECYPAIGAQPPLRQMPGVLWFNTSTMTLMVFLDAQAAGGTEGWYPATASAVGQAALRDLVDVTTQGGAVPAGHQAGVLMRDDRVGLDSKGSFRVVQRIDLGSY